MARDGSGVYHRPVGTDAVTDTTIESTKYNVNVADVETDLNLPRPIVAGGTGASSAAQALVSLGAEAAAQIVTNYDSQLWQAGSFYSAIGATAAPVTGRSFSGICYVSDPPAYPPTNLNVTLEARDRDDTMVPGALWIRVKKAGVWSAWFNTNPVVTSPPGQPGVPPPNAPDNSFWWDATRGKLFVRYNDGNSTQWVEAVAVPDLDPNAFVEITGDTMTGPLTLAGNPTLPLQAAPKQYVDTTAVAYTVQTPTAPQQAIARANIAALGSADAPVRGFLAGLALSTAGASATFGIAIGSAVDSTNAVVMALTSAYTKTTASWTLGTAGGGLDTGAIAVNKWYHVYLIRRPDTGVVDVVFSGTATPDAGPTTMPTGYTQYRRIGALRTNSSSQWIKFIQIGDKFLWDPIIADCTGLAVGASVILLSLTVPAGLIVTANFFCYMTSAAANAVLSLASPLITLPSINSPVGNIALMNSVGTSFAAGQFSIETNAASQIQACGNSLTINIGTQGWIDRRGRDA